MVGRSGATSTLSRVARVVKGPVCVLAAVASVGYTCGVSVGWQRHPRSACGPTAHQLCASTRREQATAMRASAVVRAGPLSRPGRLSVWVLAHLCTSTRSPAHGLRPPRALRATPFGRKSPAASVRAPTDRESEGSLHTCANELQSGVQAQESLWLTLTSSQMQATREAFAHIGSSGRAGRASRISTQAPLRSFNRLCVLGPFDSLLGCLCRWRVERASHLQMTF